MLVIIILNVVLGVLEVLVIVIEGLVRTLERIRVVVHGKLVFKVLY